MSSPEENVVVQPIEIDQLTDELDAWIIPQASLESIRDRARESLNEVKQFVDYQDKAASGMLTVVAFLTAAASLVYQRLATDYFWPAAFDTPQHVVTAATYAVFMVYLLLVSYSAFLVFKALLPRYAIPKETAKWLRGGPSGGVPGSTLFYRGILSVPPAQWGKFFTTLTAPRPAIPAPYDGGADEMYAKFAVLESYLVADDAQKKVDAVTEAGGFLRASMIALIIFAGLYGLNTVSVRPDRVTTTAPAAAKAPAQTTAGEAQSAASARP